VRNTLLWLTLLVATGWAPGLLREARPIGTAGLLDGLLHAGTVGHAASSRLPGQAATPAQGQTEAAPTFRAGVDLVTVDVTVLDRNGRPIEDLKAEDFTVKIDGTSRRVVAAELVKAGADANVKQGQTGGVAFDAGRTPARKILIAVDQLAIPPGSLRPLLDAAGRFIDSLAPKDLIGLVTFPGPGPRTDFTTDRAQVKKAMEGLIGMPSIRTSARMNIGLVEARTINDRERHQTPRPDLPNDEVLAAVQTPVLRDLMARNCDPTGDLQACIRQIVNESAEISQRTRTDAKISRDELESIMQSLASIDGAKTLVLVSASLSIDDPRDLDGVISWARTARTSFSVLIVDPFVDDGNVASQTHEQAPTTNQDRRLRNEGLEELAADGRGAVYRVAGTGDGIFERIALELSASYVLGVESVADDLRPSTRKVDVAVKRQDARVQNRQAYVRTVAPKSRPIEEVLKQTLESGTELTELPVRVSTFAQWDPQSDKVRVSLAADIPQSGAAGEYAVGYVVMDAQNQSVASRAQKRSRVDAGTSAKPTPYGESLLLVPGTYSLRFSVVDANGKRASVVRAVTVARTAGTMPATSDLIVGNVTSSTETPRLAGEPKVTSGVVGMYLELYAEKPEDLDWTFVHLEVARSAQSAALATADADMADGARPSWRIARGVVDVRALPPGDYVARVRIAEDDKTIKVLTQPFIIER
jgi:VWFA-related protein